MAKCTGMRCPMQAGYKVDECDYKDCPYRTEPMTNADRIRAMSDEELAEMLWKTGRNYRAVCADPVVDHDEQYEELVKWLQQPVEICFHEFCIVAGDSPCGCDGCPYGKYGSDDGECYEEYKKDKLAKLEKAMPQPPKGE